MELTPKKLIFDALRNNFGDLNLKFLIIEHCLDNGSTNIVTKDLDGNKNKFIPKKAENVVLKNLLLKKILKVIKKKEENKDIEKLFIRLVFDTNDMGIFYKDRSVKEIVEFKSS